MLGEGLMQRVAGQIRQAWQPAERTHRAYIRNNALVFLVFLTDENHALHRNGALPQRLERQQRVVDGAERGSGAQNERNLPAGKDIDEDCLLYTSPSPRDS